MSTKTPTMIGADGHAVRSKVLSLRRKRGLSQSDLSNLLKATGRPILPTAICRIERGERRIDIDDLFALAAALGVTPGQLLEPPEKCSACSGQPPAGFACLACGSAATTPDPEACP